jgi:uncharacterized protein (TIGR02646 family)
VIAIQKGAAPPGLVRAGEKHTKELCDAYEAAPELYRGAKRKMAVRPSIYASKAVKAKLEDRHHGKCCYCETLIPKPYAHPHVEHWRPKSSSRQVRGKKRIWPGYYWLAYSWDNLLWSCFFCNSTNKDDLFPLVNPAARARHHGMRVEDEMPAILKPDGDKDPRDHITFRGDQPFGLTPLGRKTVKVLGLDSPKHGLRHDHLEKIKKARELSIDLVVSVEPKLRQHAEHFRDFVEEAVRPEKPYSAMVAAFLEANPLPDRSA